MLSREIELQVERMPMAGNVRTGVQEILTNIGRSEPNQVIDNGFDYRFMQGGQAYTINCSVGFPGQLLVDFAISDGVKRSKAKVRNMKSLQLSKYDIARLHVSFSAENDDIVVSPSGLTRKEFEGRGLMTGLLAGLPQAISTFEEVIPYYFDGRGLVLEFEDLSRAQSSGRNHTGFSTYMAQTMGFEHAGGKLWTKRLR